MSQPVTRRTVLGMLLASPLTACVFANEEAAQTTGTPLRVLSYNMHIGVGLDGKRDLERIADVIKASKADLVGLQEVDKGAARSLGVDQPSELAKLTGMHASYGRTIDITGGEYGLLILSRYPILQTEHHPLRQASNREQRIAQAVRVKIDDAGREVLFVNTHLDYVADDGDRLVQIQHISELYSERDSVPIIMLGDFNDHPDSPAIKLLTPHWRSALPQDNPTFPADKPTRQIDYIFTRPTDKVKVREIAVMDEPVASDHRPVVATLEIGG